MAFNNPIADEAKTRFGSNVRCSTSHSLAHRAVGRRFQDRLNASQHMPLKRTAYLLGLQGDLAVGKRRIRATTQARLVMEMVQRFCWRTDEQVAARHLGRVNGLDENGAQYLAQVLLRRARWAWDEICTPGGVLPFKHDHYLKMWALTRPRLPGDFVLLDEAQDTNPVLEGIQQQRLGAASGLKVVRCVRRVGACHVERRRRTPAKCRTGQPSCCAAGLACVAVDCCRQAAGRRPYRRILVAGQQVHGAAAAEHGLVSRVLHLDLKTAMFEDRLQ